MADERLRLLVWWTERLKEHEARLADRELPAGDRAAVQESIRVANAAIVGVSAQLAPPAPPAGEPAFSRAGLPLLSAASKSTLASSLS